MTLTSEESERLRDAGVAATRFLAEMPERIVPAGDTHHVLHDDYAERAVSMSRYLSMAHRATVEGEHAPAYALLRCALEHHLVDHLLFRADRYVVQGPTSQETFARWQEQVASGEPGTETIVELTRNEGGHTRIVRSGPHLSNADGERLHRLSAYYGYLDEFDPLAGPPDQQRFLELDWTLLDHAEEHAREQQRLYGQALTWKGLRDNIELNGFYTGEDLVRLNVHHRFLSGFVHLTPASYRVPHKRPNAVIPYREQYREHIAEELAYLYVAALAARELTLLLDGIAEPPLAHVVDVDAVTAAALGARQTSAHLWFPGDEPHAYDRWLNENAEAWRREGSPTREQVGVSEPYYRDPFERLAALHRPNQGPRGNYQPRFNTL